MATVMRPSPDPQDRNVPIVVPFSSRDGTLTKDGRMMNCYAEKSGDHAKAWRRPGLTPGPTTFGAGQAMTSFNHGLVVVGGSTAYSATFTRNITSFSTGVSKYYLYYGGFVYGIPQFSTGQSVRIDSVTGTSTNISGFPGASVAAATLHAGKMYVTLTGNPTVVQYSTDGSTWGTTPACGVLVGGLLASNGTRLVATNSLTNGAAYAYSDNNGTNWTTGVITSSGGTNVLAGYGNGFFWGISTSNGTIQKSTDGITWTLVATDATMFPNDSSFGSIAFLGGVMYTRGISGGVASVVCSVDGITWSKVVTLSGYTAAPFSTTPLPDTVFQGASVKYGILGQAIAITGKASIGTLAVPSSEQIDLLSNTSATKLFIKGRNAAYILTASTGAITQVTDIDYPSTTVRGAVYLNGNFYVMAPDGTIWGSADDDASSWATDNFISAEFEPDDGVCLSKYMNYVVALGQWTVEMFWDAANATGSPLSPVQNGVMLVGCAHGDSVVQVESTLLWIAQRKGSGSTSQKGRFIAMLQGTNYTQISTSDIDRVLDADDLATVYSSIASLSGHTFYMLTLGTSAVTLVYDMQSKIWYVWTRRTATSPVTITALTQSNGLATATAAAHGLSDGDFVTISGATQAGYNLSLPVTVTSSSQFTYPVAAATVSPATGSPVVTGSTEGTFDMSASINFNSTQMMLDVGTGNLWTFAASVYTDNSQPIDMRIRTNSIDNGNNETKFCSSVSAIGDITATADTALMRHSDDDFQTNTFYRRFDLSQRRPALLRWGKYRRRSWEYRYNGTLAHRLGALEVEIEQGNS